MELAAAVYTAHRGYAWSWVPPGLTEATLDALYSRAAENRPEFPTETDVERGVVSDGIWAAAFTIRNVQSWDSEGRAADYAAFAFLRCADAGRVDFNALLAHDFFRVPQRVPAASIVYEGPAALTAPLDAPGRLLCRHSLDALDVRSIGTLLATYGAKSPAWSFHVNGEFAAASCAPWRT